MCKANHFHSIKIGLTKKTPPPKKTKKQKQQKTPTKRVFPDDRNKVKWENEPEPDYSSKEPGKC